MRINAGVHSVYPLDGEQHWKIDRPIRDQRLLDSIAVAMIDAGLTPRQVMAADIHGDENQPTVTFTCVHYHDNRKFGEHEITVPLS